MDPNLAQLIQLLATYGPWLLFVLAVLETSFVTGLVVPSGVATSAATVLALEGEVELAPFVMAAVSGGAVGDSVGFFIGRAWGQRLLDGDGYWARLARRHRDAMDLLGRHPFYSVTVARLVSFVRTLMPMAAGMSGITYRRYLPFEVMGVLGWGALYVAIGLAARESWVLATRLVGWGGTVVFVVMAVVFVHLVRRRRRASRNEAAPTGSASAPSGSPVGVPPPPEEPRASGGAATPPEEPPASAGARPPPAEPRASEGATPPPAEPPASTPTPAREP